MNYTLEDLRKINNLKIEEYTNNDIKELKIQLAIKEVLKDKKCFFKMEATTAIDLLTKLIEKENIKETYMDLISAKNFKNSMV